MKRIIILLFQALLCLSLSIAQTTQDDLTSSELFDKVIRHYDPEGIWDTYKGSMHIYTINSDRISHEEIGIDNSKSYYKNVQYVNDSTFIVIKEKNKITFSVNEGAKMDADKVPKRFTEGPYNLNEGRANTMSEWHTAQFSVPLVLKTAEQKPDPQVQTQTLFGAECQVISFPGSFQSLLPSWDMEVKNIHLYIDPSNDYRLHAVHLEGNYWGFPKGLIHLYNGELTVEGLVIPARKIFFDAATHAYFFSDVFFTTPPTH